MMQRFARLAAVLLVVTLLVSPLASAKDPIFSKVIDDHIGDVNDRINDANSTYGEREEFQRSRASLARASLSLVNNASIVAEDSLIKSAGGVETGKARAQAGGQETGQKVVNHGRSLASQAQSQLDRVRNNLQGMEKTGLEPVAFSGGLTVAHSANRAVDLLEQYERALNQWQKEGQNQDLEAAIVSSAAGAQIMASVASDTLERVAQARTASTPASLLSYEDLQTLTQDRVDWTNKHAGAIGKQTRERVTQMHNNDEQLMTLAAYTSHFQNIAFNGLRQEIERGNTDEDPHETAWELYNRSQPRVEDWIQTVRVPGDLPLGALQSAHLTLEINKNSTGENRQTSGAFAVGLIHLGVEHTGLLQEAYGGEAFEPGTELSTASLDDGATDGWLPVPTPAALAVGGLVVAAVAGLAALGRRRETS